MKIIIRSIVVLLLVAFATLLLAANTRLYYIRDESGGQIVWSAEEAYLFMEETRRGFHFSYLEYPWVILKQYLNAPPLPDDKRSSLTVIRVAPSTIKRDVVDVAGIAPTSFTFVEGHIYANCEGVLCKWTGTSFAPATAEEQRKLDGINGLAPDKDVDVRGWSKRGIGKVASDHQFPVAVGRQLTLLVKEGNISRDYYDSASIDLLRPGKAPESVWRVDGHPRQISRTEYEQVFQKR